MLLFLAACVCFAQDKPDVRVVNGVTVDLSPVHKWLESRQGERPLQQWKQFTLVEPRGTVSLLDRCLVTSEAGGKKEILIANLPRESKAALTTLAQQLVAIQKATAIIENDERKLRIAGASTNSDSYATGESYANLKKAKEDLAKMQQARLASLSALMPKLDVLAMFTGSKMQDLEVWDCGREK